jgi:branched-chain amino acid transport system substrate-binding protein
MSHHSFPLLSLVLAWACSSCRLQRRTHQHDSRNNDRETGRGDQDRRHRPADGGAAVYGSSVANGAKIALEEVNALGGLQFELKFEDDEHDAEKSVNAYNSLKDWGMQILCGTVTTTPGIAVTAESFKDRIFTLTPSASSTSVIEGKDNVFQMCFTDPNQGIASAQYIAENKLGSKIAIIYNNADAYSTGIYEKFISEAAGKNLQVVSTTTFTDDTANDFNVQLTAAKNAGADLIFLPIYYQPASLILTQADAMGYEPSSSASTAWTAIDHGELQHELARGVMLLTRSRLMPPTRAPSLSSPSTKRLQRTAQQFAADGYD